jgi:hypothetical protein
MSKANNYDPKISSDVRQFAQEIARLTSSGPAGVVQAKRLLKETAQTSSGKELVKKAREHGKILARSLSVDFKEIKTHTGSGDAAKQLKAEAFSSGQNVFLQGGSFAPGSDKGMELIAHELTHVVQQSSGKKGK